MERLQQHEYGLIREMLVELHLAEQVYYPDHPQLARSQIERDLARVPGSFTGENVIFGVRERDALVGFCWCVLFDPGTGLEGEIAELFVSDSARGQGVGRALVQRAVELFRERGVTLAYVWTRDQNDHAVRLYRGAGFADPQQLVLTWYPFESGSRTGEPRIGP